MTTLSSRSRSVRLLRRRRSGGYTAVEVLMSMTLFAIGAAGVIGMQRATIQGSEDARRYDMAVNIANTWASRLQRDAAYWNQSYATNKAGVIAVTRYVTLIGSTDCKAKWCNPTGAITDETAYYDLIGRERPKDSKDHVFCVQVKTDWVATPASAENLATPASFARSQIRVVFQRLDRGPIGDCTGLGDGDLAPEVYQFVHVTTALRENTL